ncbi:MAG: phage integrase SAM-like domain-containing protein [Flavobacteriales bacterium]
MKTSISILTSKTTKNGHPIYVELFISAKNRPRKIIGYSQLHFWDAENNNLLKQHPEYHLLLPKILDYKAKCIKIDYGDYSPEEAKNILFDIKDASNDESKQAMFLDFFDIRIKEKKAKGESHESYSDVKKIILKYIDPKTDIPINAITYEWLNAFILYAISTTRCEMGGAMSYLRTMRAVYKEAQRRTSLKVKQDNPFLGIMKTPTPKAVIEITPNQLKLDTEYKSNTTNKKSAAVSERNFKLLLFQFYIGGHDLADVALLKWKQIKNNRVVFRRYKNRNKTNGGPLVDNKLFAEALNIIEAYGNKETDRVFSFIPSPIKNQKEYSYFRRTYNRSLEAISKNKNLPEYLKSKSTRYLFRTYSGELLIHNLIVMKLQGHTPEGITYNYQGSISYQVMDDAHRKIIDYALNEKTPEVK